MYFFYIINAPFGSPVSKTLYCRIYRIIYVLTILILIDNVCIALFSGVPKLTALYNILQRFLSFTNIMHIIMTTMYNIHVHVPYEKQQYIKRMNHITTYP